jgi:hypothetical protein
MFQSLPGISPAISIRKLFAFHQKYFFLVKSVTPSKADQKFVDACESLKLFTFSLLLYHLFM